MKPITCAAAVLLFVVPLGAMVFTYESVAQPTNARDGSAAQNANKAVDEKTIRAFIKQLGDDAFEKREQAEKRLIAIGAPALELLRETAKESTDAEVRERAGRVLRGIDQQVVRRLLEINKWGTLVDPEQDSALRLEDGKLHIKVPPKARVLTAEIGVTNAPRVVREVDGDFHAEVKVTGPIPGDARSVLDGRWPYYAAGLLVWDDERNFLRLDRAKMYHVGQGEWRCHANWQLRHNGLLTRPGGAVDGLLDQQKPSFFRLRRTANSFAASYSQDGKTWKELPPIDVAFSKKLKVGVSAIQNTPAGYEAIFQDLKIIPTKPPE
jgi:regulation of enolase protein 1 (concanavalin A-like superfamily)